MVLSSDDKAHKVIKAQRSANDFLSFFSQWTGIRAAEITPRYRFISEQKAGPVYITNFQLQKVDYAHLGTDEFTVINRAGPASRPGRPSAEQKSAPRGGFSYHRSD